MVEVLTTAGALPGEDIDIRAMKVSERVQLCYYRTPRTEPTLWGASTRPGKFHVKSIDERQEKG